MTEKNYVTADDFATGRSKVSAMVCTATHFATFELSHQDLAVLNLKLDPAFQRLGWIDAKADALTDVFGLFGVEITNWDLMHCFDLEEVTPEGCIFRGEIEE